MGLVREVLGRSLVFVTVSLIFLGGPLLGLVGGSAAPSGDPETELAFEGNGGRDIWVGLWESAANAAEVSADVPAEGTAAADAPPSPTPADGEAIALPAAGGTVTAMGAPAAKGAEGGGTKRAKGKKCEDDPVPGIATNGTDRWTVHRDLVHVYTRSFKRLNDLGYSKRHLGPDGKADGMYIGGVRCNSDLHRAGIRSGDVVHSVNGREVTSIPDAVFVYARVRNDNVVRVELTRRGVRKTFVYHLVG